MKEFKAALSIILLVVSVFTAIFAFIFAKEELPYLYISLITVYISIVLKP